MSATDDIVSNKLIEAFRFEMRIDRDEFARLCDAISRLQIEWRNRDLIEKVAMSCLYSAPSIVSYMAGVIGSVNPDAASELEEMNIVLDGLILDALRVDLGP